MRYVRREPGKYAVGLEDSVVIGWVFFPRFCTLVLKHIWISSCSLYISSMLPKNDEMQNLFKNVFTATAVTARQKKTPIHICPQTLVSCCQSGCIMFVYLQASSKRDWLFLFPRSRRNTCFLIQSNFCAQLGRSVKRNLGGCLPPSASSTDPTGSESPARWPILPPSPA